MNPKAPVAMAIPWEEFISRNQTMNFFIDLLLSFDYLCFSTGYLKKDEALYEFPVTTDSKEEKSLLVI